MANIVLLALLGSSCQKEDEALAVFAKIDAVTWSEVDLAFKNTGAHAFDMREVPKSDTVERSRYLSRGLCVEVLEPLGKRTMAVTVLIFANGDHLTNSNINTTIREMRKNGF